MPLLPQNLPAWNLWQLVQTQWRVNFGPVGLDYPAVFAVAALHNIHMDAELFAAIQAIEFDVIEEFREHQQNQAS